MASQIHGKLGCLKNTERLGSRSAFGGTNQVVVQETFACTMVTFERPESGSSLFEVSCPHCAEPVTVKVVSAESMQTTMMVAALAISGTVLGIGCAMAFSGYFEDKGILAAANIVMGVGGLGLLLSMGLGFLLPSVFDYQRDALRIVRDFAGESSTAVGFAGARGHRMLEVWVKEARVPHP